MDKKMSIRFFIDERKKSKKTGNTPVFMRISKNGSKAEARLDLELNEDELKIWNPASGMLDTQDESHVNYYISNLKELFRSLKTELKITQPYISAKEIRNLMLEKISPTDSSPVTILSYARKYCDEHVFGAKKHVDSTKKKYRVAVDHLERFLSCKGLKDLGIQHLDAKIARDYATFLMTDDPDNGKTAMLEVSASGNNKKMKTIFDAAVNDGLILRNPFKLNKLSNKSKEQPKLTPDQIRKFLLMKDLPEPMMMYVQLFQFMILTGYNFADCMALKKSAFDEFEGKNVVRAISRQKTGSVSRQYYTSHAMRVLLKLIEYPTNGDSLLPSVTLNTTNIYLKRAAKLLRIDLNVSTAVARKAFKTILSEAGVDQDIAKIHMGWCNPQDLNIIYTLYTERRLVESLDRSEDYLTKLLSENDHQELTEELPSRRFDPFSKKSA